jgi:hypothetical protein
LLLDGNATSAANERGVELVDIPGVIERPWQIGPERAILGWGRRTLAYGP